MRISFLIICVENVQMQNLSRSSKFSKGSFEVISVHFYKNQKSIEKRKFENDIT